MSADSVSVAGMGVAVYAFQHSGNRQDGEGPLDREPGLEGGSAGSALPAGAALGAPFGETGRAVIGGAGSIDGSERSAEFYIQGAGYAGEGRMDGGAPVSVFRLADAPAGMGTVSGSAWAAHHDQRGLLDTRGVPTDHLHRLGKPIGLGFDSRRY